MKRLYHIHWKSRAVKMATLSFVTGGIVGCCHDANFLSSHVAPQVVATTTWDATCDDKVDLTPWMLLISILIVAKFTMIVTLTALLSLQSPKFIILTIFCLFKACPFQWDYGRFNELYDWRTRYVILIDLAVGRLVVLIGIFHASFFKHENFHDERRGS